MLSGGVLRFHPRLIHCGDRFQYENVRIHYYVHPARQASIPNVTHTPTGFTLETIAKAHGESIRLGNISKAREEKKEKEKKNTAIRLQNALKTNIGEAKKRTEMDEKTKRKSESATLSAARKRAKLDLDNQRRSAHALRGREIQQARREERKMMEAEDLRAGEFWRAKREIQMMAAEDGREHGRI